LQGCGGRGGHCASPDTLSRGEEQMRKTKEYAEISPSAHESCANCDFFRSYEEDECGHCEILDGPVNEGGYCTSWASRG
jgi:hypothetical protein